MRKGIDEKEDNAYYVGNEKISRRYGNILWYLNKIRKNLIINSTKNYSIEEMESLIEYWMDFVVSGDIQVKVVREKYITLEGQKRLTTINNFVDGKIKCHGKFYEELFEDEKEFFLNIPISFMFVTYCKKD